MSYQHPITFTPTGDPARDFRPALEDFDTNLAPLLPPAGAAVLDVGCGWGQFLWWLRWRGYHLSRGLDVGAQQVEYCRTLGLDAHLVSDSIAYLRERPLAWDVIVLNHVIEHVPGQGALALLEACRGALRVGGVAIVQTPNMSAISASFCRHIELSHVTGFTENSIREALELAGFSDVRVIGTRSRFKPTFRRSLWLLLQLAVRSVWRVALIADLGSDAPRILGKNLYAMGRRPGPHDRA